MASKYWLKLYHEMLDDPKVMTLRPALRWRFVETLLVAGELDKDGFLPDIKSYSWRVRDNAEVVETEFMELAEAGLLSQDNGRWLVTKFADRQAADSPTERWRKWKERQHKQEYYSDVTNHQRNANESFDREDIDIDKEEIRGEERGAPPAADSLSIESQIIRVVSDATGMVAIPPNEEGRRQQIYALIEQYGVESVSDAFRDAFGTWINQDRKDGRGKYKRTNFGWVDWAQEILAGGEIATEPKSKDEEWLDNWRKNA